MTNTIWILGTVERALKTAATQGLNVRSARLNPIDFKALSDSITKRVVAGLPVPTSIVLISDDGISVGYTRLECFKPPSGLEFAKQVDELQSAMGVDVKVRKARGEDREAELMIDWKQVVETLRRCMRHDGESHEAAITLCELAARLPPGEAERVLEAAANTAELRAAAEREVRHYYNAIGGCLCGECAQCEDVEL